MAVCCGCLSVCLFASHSLFFSEQKKNNIRENLRAVFSFLFVVSQFRRGQLRVSFPVTHAVLCAALSCPAEACVRHVVAMFTRSKHQNHPRTRKKRNNFRTSRHNTTVFNRRKIKNWERRKVWLPLCFTRYFLKLPPKFLGVRQYFRRKCIRDVGRLRRSWVHRNALLTWHQMMHRASRIS